MVEKSGRPQTPICLVKEGQKARQAGCASNLLGHFNKSSSAYYIPVISTREMNQSDKHVLITQYACNWIRLVMMIAMDLHVLDKNQGLLGLTQSQFPLLLLDISSFKFQVSTA